MKKANLKIYITVLLLCAVCVCLCSCELDFGFLMPEPETTVVTTTAPPTEPPTTAPHYEKYIAFSFDDGPRSSTTGRVLDALEKQNFTATFFVCGYNIEGCEQVMRRAVSLGCEIGNHSWSHANLSKASAEKRKDEIDRNNLKIKDVTGVEPKLLRAPYGAYSKLKENVDMPICQWSVDTNDWRKKECAGDKEEVEALTEYILKNTDNGSIVLMHDIYDFSAEVVENVMPKLAENGYCVMSISELYEHFGIEMKGGHVYFHPQVQQEQTAQ